LFNDILDLISQPPGSLVYHFVVLFAVEAAFAISLGQWLRDRNQSSVRLTIAALAIMLTRLLVFVASLLAWQGYLPRNVLIPPIERASDTISVLALVWAFITMDDPELLGRNFFVDVSAAVFTGMLLAGFGGTYYYWYYAAASGDLFNGLWLDLAWGGAQIFLTIAGLIWFMTRAKYAYDPILKGLLLIVLGAGSALHLIRPPLGDVASAVRAIQVIAMPMLAAVAYRHVIEQLLHWDEFTPSRVLPAIPDTEVPAAPPSAAPAPESHPATERKIARSDFDEPDDTVVTTKLRPGGAQAPVLDVVEALASLVSTLDQADVVNEATRAVAGALRADICVLAVVDEATQEAGILGGYDNIAQAHLPQAVLDLALHPSIVNTLGRLRQMKLTPQRNQRELKDLYNKLLITHLGPAYMQPLTDRQERIGVLIVGSPYSERMLSNEERNLLDRLAPLVTGMLINAENYQRVREESEQTMQEEGARLASLSDDLMAANSELNSAQRQMDEMKAYIRDMHRQLEAARTEGGDPEALREVSAQAKALEEELAALKKNQADLQAEPQSGAEITRLRADNERLLQKVLQQRHEVDRLQQQIQSASKESAASEKPPAQESRSAAVRADFQRELEDTRQALQAELGALRARLMTASIGQQEVAFLQEQLVLKAREAILLQTRLAEADAVAGALREQVNSSRSGARGLESLQARIAAQTSEIDELKMRLAEAETNTRLEPATLRDMDRRDDEATARFESGLTDRLALVETLQAQLSDKNRALAELKGYMNDVESSLRNLDKQLSSKTAEIAALQISLSESRAQAQERIAAMQSDGSESADVQRAHIQGLEAELAEKSSAIQTLESQLANATESIAAFERQLSATHDAVDAAIADAGRQDTHDEVVASIAQELRTPMSSIMGYTELLLGEKMGILGALQRKFLRRVKANTERMGVLLDDLVRITAIDMGRLELSLEKVDVLYAVEETVMNVANQFREKGITLRMALAESLPPVTADRSALLQIMGHLLTNAALATPVEGEVSLSVEARRESLNIDGDEIETNCLYIGVQDTGAGITEADFEHVFTRRYRADAPLIEGLGDTGVSLSLAKTLIDAHHGRIWLDSEMEKGTTFHVLLPISALAKEGAA
jgi:signal transduction histidine kinase